MRRALIVSIILVLSAALIWFGWERARERYVLPWVGATIAQHVQRRSGWRLNYRGISGNVFTGLRLYGVRLEPAVPPRWLKNPSTEIALLADSMEARYQPLELLHGRLRQVEVQGCRVRFGTTELSLQVMQMGELLAVSWPTQRLPMEAILPLLALPERTTLEGDVHVGGEWLLKGYRPHLMQMQLRAEDLRVRWGVLLDARMDVDLKLSGPHPFPSLTGTVDVTKGRWSGEATRPVGSVVGDPVLVQWTKDVPGVVDVHMTGKNFWVHTERLHAKFQADMLLKKPLDEPARLVGRVEALEGTYHVRTRRFTLREGQITFADKVDGSPRMDAELETRVKRYRIRAGVHGTLRESHLQLTSVPELTQKEILSLMVFGRLPDRLSIEESQQLTQQDEDAQALDLLFMGQAELLAARVLGLDEINVNVNVAPYTAIGTTQSPIESVEIGKYVIPDRLFGSYQLEPKQSPTDTNKHTVGAEYELTDNFSVGATVKAAMRDHTTTPLDSTQPPAISRRLEAQEALIRFRWKF